MQTYTVIQITRKLKSFLSGSGEFRNVSVKGELGSVSYPSSGHIYFSLKDSESILKCNFFSFNHSNYKGPRLRDGMEVIVNGEISIYEKGGVYNLNVKTITQDGEGDILQQIEKLKEKLLQEGLFDTKHKKNLPPLPKTLGIATSPTGAAIADIIKIALELYPNLNILVAPCVVQGDGSVESIVDAIELLNHPDANVDVIISGRGGGAFEDLIAFNSEKVVRAFFNSRVPIISAVGHETDRVLSDYSADASSPTPTAAAKLAIPNTLEITQFLDDLDSRIQLAVHHTIQVNQTKLDSLVQKQIFKEPKQLLSDRKRILDETIQTLKLLGRNYILTKKSRLKEADRLQPAVKVYFNHFKNQFGLIEERLEHFSPLLTLKRGYSVVRDLQKNVILKSSSVKKGDSLEIILHQGILEVNVENTTKEITP